MSKFVALTAVAVSLALGACRPVAAGEPHPLCCEFWKDAWEDPFGCKAACKAAAPAPAAAPACPAPACTPKTEPPAPPATPEAPPAPTTAQRNSGQQRSFSYDPAPASQAAAARAYSRPIARSVSPYRADRKLHGL